MAKKQTPSSIRYWEKRRELEDKARLKMEDGMIKSLTKNLTEALEKIQVQLLSQADLHNMTQAELLEDYSLRDQKRYRKYIDKNYKELMKSDEKYQEFIDEYFPSYDYAKVNRLLQIRTDIFNILATEMIKTDPNKKFNDGLEEIINKTYNSNSNALMYLLGPGDFNPLPKKELENMLNYPWSGKTFSNRLWGNISRLEQNLSNAIVNSVASGQGVVEALKTMKSDEAISSMFKLEENKFKKAIENLVRTEYAHFAVDGLRASMKEAGIEKEQSWSAEDERVCIVCGERHGKLIKDDWFPPYHGRCRCTVIPKMPELGEDIDSLYDEMFGDLLDEFAKDKFGIKLNKVKDEKLTNREYNVVNEELMDSLQKESDSWFTPLEVYEKESIIDYTGSSYKSMNYLLRNPPKEIGFLDEVTYSQINDFSEALSKFKLKEDIITYRGISQAEYNEILNNSVFKDFKSTSVKMRIAKNFKEDNSSHKLVTFKIPKGTDGAYIGNHSMVDLEKEFTLNYGTKYKVKETEEGLEVTVIGRE